MIYEINREEAYKIKELFKGFNDTMIDSYVHGYMGKAWVDNKDNPKVAHIKVGVFNFFSGDSECEESKELVKNLGIDSLIILEDSNWSRLIEEECKDKFIKLKRYSFERSFENFHRELLKSFVDKLPDGYELRKIDKEIVNNKTFNELTTDFTDQFDSIEDYLEKGVGFCILNNNRVVSGASSYNVYNDGIEIEIDTLKEYRRKGLAKIVASALILHCLENNIYPNWDAANLESVGLAQKLGYIMKEEYDSYYIY